MYKRQTHICDTFSCPHFRRLWLHIAVFICRLYDASLIFFNGNRRTCQVAGACRLTRSRANPAGELWKAVGLAKSIIGLLLSLIHISGDTIAQASQISCEKMPASIEIAGVTPDDYNIITNSAAGSSADFEIFNISLQGDSITGEVTNTSAIGYDDGFVATAIFRDADGHIVTGATGYFTNKIAAGETTAFDINCMFDPAEYAYDTITVTAYGGI